MICTDLAVALCYAAFLGHHERNPAEVERLASELMELSARYNLRIGSLWQRFSAVGLAALPVTPPKVFRGSKLGIRDYRATGTVLGLPGHLAKKAEALHLADRTSEDLESIAEAQVLVERFEDRCWCSELHWLRGIFLAAMGADEAQREASFCEAIRIAREQKSVSLEKRAEAAYAEYRRQRASGSGEHGIRLTTLIAACNSPPVFQRFSRRLPIVDLAPTQSKTYSPRERPLCIALHRPRTSGVSRS